MPPRHLKLLVRTAVQVLEMKLDHNNLVRVLASTSGNYVTVIPSSLMFFWAYDVLITTNSRSLSSLLISMSLVLSKVCVSFVEGAVETNRFGQDCGMGLPRFEIGTKLPHALICDDYLVFNGFHQALPLHWFHKPIQNVVGLPECRVRENVISLR